MAMTNTQIDVITELRGSLLTEDAKGSLDWEYKQFDVQEFAQERAVFLWSVTGHKGDENTLAAILYRTEHMIWIGPRGRVIRLNKPKHHPGHELVAFQVALRERVRVKPRRAVRVREPEPLEEPHKASA
jgi:hypothetical protein